MSRVPRVIVDPRQPQSIAEHQVRIQRVVDGDVEFGSPQDPIDPQSVVVPAGVAGGHNGTLLNMAGSWFTLLITGALPQLVDVTCRHNLDVAVLGAVPVRWLVFGWSHDGTGGGTADYNLSVWYNGGAVTADSIVLRASAAYNAGASTIDATHPLRLDLFFTRAVR